MYDVGCGERPVCGAKVRGSGGGTRMGRGEWEGWAGHVESVSGRGRLRRYWRRMAGPCWQIVVGLSMCQQAKGYET